MEKLTVFGTADPGALAQMENVLRDGRAVRGALMADNHLGYSMPIGGVVEYENAISPTGVGYDIACGNLAVKTNLTIGDFNLEPWLDSRVWHGEAAERSRIFKPFMRQIQKKVAFGIGRSNPDPVDHELFDSPVWLWLEAMSPGLKSKAADQLGTVGSGNHYVDLLVDEAGTLWVANHFGSRGLGHTIANGFMALDQGLEFSGRAKESDDPIVLNLSQELGAHYEACMKLAGTYAYAGREFVAQQVLKILGAEMVSFVHNHHNYAWREGDRIIVRKGATPLTVAPAFIGGSMGDDSVIVRGKYDVVDNAFSNTGYLREVVDLGNIGSAPHGAGRVMSRTKAAGKLRKMWYCGNQNCAFQPFRGEHGNSMSGYEKGKCPDCGIPLRKGRIRDISDALIDWGAVRASLTEQGIVVLGAGADEAPGVYKQLPDVLAAHANVEIIERLRPIGVVMAGSDEFDPYKD